MTTNLLIDKIDNSFIEKWSPKYDETETDDKDYDDIIKLVREEVSQNKTISQSTFDKLYSWKTADRSKWRVKRDKYTIYEDAFREVLDAQEDDKKVELLEKLPGIGIPVASTFLHFIYPDRFPIVDVRTVEVLQKAKCLDNSSVYHFRDTIKGYHSFRDTINKIFQQQKSKWTLRQIDKALFAFHKQEMAPKKACN